MEKPHHENTGTSSARSRRANAATSLANAAAAPKNAAQAMTEASEALYAASHTTHSITRDGDSTQLTVAALPREIAWEQDRRNAGTREAANHGAGDERHIIGRISSGNRDNSQFGESLFDCFTGSWAYLAPHVLEKMVISSHHLRLTRPLMNFASLIYLATLNVLGLRQFSARLTLPSKRSSMQFL